MAATLSGPAAPFSQAQIDDCLTALVAWAGNANAAVKYLQAEGKRSPSVGTLSSWSRTTHWERYEQLRDQFAQRAEGALANNYLDAARYATETAMLAVEKARKRLEDDKDEDPGRTAANLSRVAQSATDKRLSLQGRPTQIIENRDPAAIMRSLIARHPQLFQLTDEPAQIEGTVAQEAESSSADE